MKKAKLTEAVNKHKTETAEAIQTMLDALNQGQRKKIVKDEKVAKLMEKYGIEEIE